jgi:hypothetical protein
MKIICWLLSIDILSRLCNGNQHIWLKAICSLQDSPDRPVPCKNFEGNFSTKKR